ncbi:Hypothetical predicted protein [Podarcis lilfordi]|uniref:Uncharacterized protein n=1 Tax=Podarcis lilfordi TaxID=74358 RepID=A0AA35PDV0_9SAUR|nr:Hypothetical predicted protein [Podarcis lilfordi]
MLPLAIATKVQRTARKARRRSQRRGQGHTEGKIRAATQESDGDPRKILAKQQTGSSPGAGCLNGQGADPREAYLQRLYYFKSSSAYTKDSADQR